MPQGISRYKNLTKAAIALGSNLACGELSSEMLIKVAFFRIPNDFIRLKATSSLYHTPCIPAGAGPDYVNAAALVETTLDAASLLAHLHEVEHAFARRRESRWAARTLDLDLIDFGGEIQPDHATWQAWHDLSFEEQRTQVPDQLILPHPRLQDRAFVLAPLSEILPAWRHPVLGRTAAELMAALPAGERAAISIM